MNLERQRKIRDLNIWTHSTQPYRLYIRGTDYYIDLINNSWWEHETGIITVRVGLDEIMENCSERIAKIILYNLDLFVRGD